MDTAQQVAALAAGRVPERALNLAQANRLARLGINLRSPEGAAERAPKA
jgi:hypothetical protein